MSEDNLITNDLVENLFYSFYDKKDIKLILKEIYSFFRENTYSNLEIKRALQYYLWQRKEYIYLEYDLRYSQVCDVLENIINPINLEQEINNILNAHEEGYEENEENEENEEHEENEENEEENEEENDEENAEENNMSTTDQSLLMLEQLLNNPTHINNVVLNFTIPQQFVALQPNQLQHYIFHSMNMTMNLLNNINDGIQTQPMNDIKNVINKEELDKLPVKSWIDLDKEKYKECPICLDDYNDTSNVRILRCSHVFHVDCIDHWLTECSYKCPVCRDDSNTHHSEV